MGKQVILVDALDLITHPHVDIAARKGGLSDTARLFRNRWNLLGMERREPSPQHSFRQYDWYRTARS
jgi:hypothetical protein